MIASCDDAPDGQQAMMWHMNMILRSCPRPPRASLLACRVRRVMRLSASPGHLPLLVDRNTVGMLLRAVPPSAPVVVLSTVKPGQVVVVFLQTRRP